MNLKKIGKLIIDDFYSNTDKHDIVYGKYRGFIGVIDRGYRLFLIRPKFFPFDLDKLVESRDLLDINKRIPDADYYNEARYTNRKWYNDKIKTDCLEISDGKRSVWLDERLLKEYEKDCVLKIADNDKAPTSPVLIYEGKDLAGMVLPVRRF